MRKVSKKTSARGDTKNLAFAVAKLLLPLVIAAIAACLLGLTDVGRRLGLFMLTYAVTPLGKTLILAGPLAGLDVWSVFAGLLFVDAIESLFFVWNFDYAARIPVIGRIILIVEKKAQAAMRQRPWLGRFLYVGIVIYVAIPLFGTGPIVGTIVGRLLNLKYQWLWLMVVIGSVLASLPFIAAAFGLIYLNSFVSVAPTLAAILPF